MRGKVRGRGWGGERREGESRGGEGRVGLLTFKPWLRL